ncbi:MAG: hypothetical protein AAGA44_17930 [Pseudomonadota bacterium]
MVKWIVLAAVLGFTGWATWKRPRLTSTLVWSLTATVAGTAGALLVLPTSIKWTTLWMSLATPLVWAAFMFWCYWDKRPLRPALGLIAITAFGALAVVQLPSPI